MNFTDIIKTINRMPADKAAEMFRRMTAGAKWSLGQSEAGHINQFLLKKFLINPGEQKIIIRK